MHPELLEIPLIHITVKTYGVMMVIGFLFAVYVIRRLSRRITTDPNLITNGALYCLIAGVVGARVFYVLHYFDQFAKQPLAVFAIWQGGIELVGGVLCAVLVVFLYLWLQKLPIRQYLDILAVGLMVALIFGRIGCLWNGCCWGKPTNLPWGIRFPYGSFTYLSQVRANPARHRAEPYLDLPDEFFSSFYTEEGATKFLKPYEELTDEQQDMVDNGPYRCLRVHPTQLYSSALAGIQALILYLFWRRAQRATQAGKGTKFLTKPGSTFALMFILYGIVRFFVEFVRDDNPFEYAWWAIYRGGTASQNIVGIYLFLFGIILMVIFQRIGPKSTAPKS